MHGGKHEEKLLRENTNWFDKFAVKNLNYVVGKLYKICFEWLTFIKPRYENRCINCSYDK